MTHISKPFMISPEEFNALQDLLATARRQRDEALALNAELAQRLAKHTEPCQTPGAVYHACISCGAYPVTGWPGQPTQCGTCDQSAHDAPVDGLYLAQHAS